MPQRIARMLPNGREVLWGCSRIGGRITMVIAEGEVDTFRAQLNEWLDAGETVASSALSEQSGVTLTATNNSTSVDLAVSGVTWTGAAKLTITTSTGRKRLLALGFCVPEAALTVDLGYDAYSD